MTPANADHTPNTTGLVKKGQDLIAAGMNAVVYCGSMGDWPLLTDDQRQSGVDALTKAGVAVIVGTGAVNTHTAVSHAAHAQQVGAKGLMVIPRLLSRGTSSAAQRDHFAAILAAAPELPAVIYNSPYYGFETKADLFFDLRNEFSIGSNNQIVPINQKPQASYAATTEPGYCMWVWATVPGLSKIGRYTGDGQSTKNIDCGFTTGARLVMIKNCSRTSPWLWIVLNRTGATGDNDKFIETSFSTNSFTTPAAAGVFVGSEGTDSSANGANKTIYVESVDIMDSISTGFQIRSSADKINRTSDHYIFAAWAQEKVMFYNEKTKEIKNWNEISSMYEGRIMPSSENIEIANSLGWSLITNPTEPTPSSNLKVAKEGSLSKNKDGTYSYKWTEVNKFSKKADETAYLKTLDEETAKALRNKRNKKLSETDWTSASDVTMSDDMKTYRQALRDITKHKNWPNLENEDWPTPPS